MAGFLILFADFSAVESHAPKKMFLKRYREETADEGETLTSNDFFQGHRINRLKPMPDVHKINSQCYYICHFSQRNNVNVAVEDDILGPIGIFEFLKA